MKYIKYIFLFILLSSCKEDKMNSVSSLSKAGIKTKKDKLINSSYSQIPINCNGKQFAPTNCENNEKNLFYKFSVANNKSVIEFKYKNKTFNHSLTESISELGINSFLFENGSKMILIIDSFLEYGHTFYVYQLDIDSIKYIGSKSFDVKLDKNEIELKYNFNVSETNNNKLIIKFGSGYDDINFNISNYFTLPIKGNNLPDLDSKTQNTTLFKNFIFNFSISKIKDEDGNETKKIRINLKNKETDKVQQIDFVPGSLMTEFDVSPSSTVSYFEVEKPIINSYQEIEGGNMLIALDVNFDGLEDFAIINYQGSNGGPQYTYYVQKTNQQFVLDSYLTDIVRFCPSEINKNKKALTITHPSGCCQIQTYKFQIQRNGEWKEIYSNLEDIK